MAINENAGMIELTPQQIEGLEQAKVTAENLLKSTAKMRQAGIDTHNQETQIQEQLDQINKLLQIYK